MAGFTKRMSLKDALPSIRTFCNYRDRCHREVKEKLSAMGVWRADAEQIIVQMIEEGLLHEERFARSFARGHFYNKRWGKIKIAFELRQRGIHDRLIERALSEISEEDYRLAIVHLAERKAKELSGTPRERAHKMSRYLAQKGYAFADFRDILPNDTTQHRGTASSMDEVGRDE